VNKKWIDEITQQRILLTEQFYISPHNHSPWFGCNISLKNMPELMKLEI
jgi:hypothetical protein